MTDDIRQDPEFTKGYEEAKKAIESRKSPYNQGWHAAYQDDSKSKTPPKTAIVEVTVEREFPQFQKGLIAILREFIDLEQRNSENTKRLDERLCKLEQYLEKYIEE